MPKINREPMRRQSVSFSPRSLEQINDLIEELGMRSISEAMRYAVNLAHQKNFPNYAPPKRLRPVTEEAEGTPPKKLTKEEKKELEKANRISHGVHICINELNGAVVEDKDGNPDACAFFTYDGGDRNLQKIGIEVLPSDITQHQYKPNKKRVEKLQGLKGVIAYDPKETVEQYLEKNKK